MVGKRVQFDDATWNAINLLRQERRRSFQQLADEAFRDLLDKHGQPAKLKDQLKGSLSKKRAKKRQCKAKPEAACLLQSTLGRRKGADGLRYLATHEDKSTWCA